jgi:hypothetical protein
MRRSHRVPCRMGLFDELQKSFKPNPFDLCQCGCYSVCHQQLQKHCASTAHSCGQFIRAEHWVATNTRANLLKKDGRLPPLEDCEWSIMDLLKYMQKTTPEDFDAKS